MFKGIHFQQLKTERLDHLNVLFSQNFLGNGLTKQFKLTGTDNAVFKNGVWNASRILITSPVFCHKPDGSRVYDSKILLKREVINVESITLDGVVSLDYFPQKGAKFCISYFYQLERADLLEHYKIINLK
ncbi:unnamed protein product [marine sediment metagenome]|uniref:Uncharacterized protein n=1 Tax=marine sediment metagenome TaxID=412755 RepID=X0WXD5_9ZZZZ